MKDFPTKQTCSCTIVVQRSRKLSPIVVWLFYTALFLALLISVMVILFTRNNPKKESIFNKISTPVIRDFNRNSEITLENLKLYESLLIEKSRNIAWLDKSNDEISYRDQRDDFIVLNVTTVLNKDHKILNPFNIEKPIYLALNFHHVRQFRADNLIISPDKSYVAILWDENKLYRTNPKYRVSIREFNSGIEKKILRNGDFVSYFSFSARNDNNYSYTYDDKGVSKYYECSLNDSSKFSVTREFCQIEMTTGYKFTSNWWGSDRKKDYSISAMCPTHKAYWNDDENTSLNDTLIDGILYQGKGTILLYPKVEKITYNRAVSTNPLELGFRSQFSGKKYKPTFYFFVDGKKNWIPEGEEFTGINTVSNDSLKTKEKRSNIMRRKKEVSETEEDYTATKLEDIDFGMNRQHIEHISRSYCRDKPLSLVSVDYTVDYPEEKAIFYSLQGKNNSYYFPSKEKAFFIEPAFGTIQLDTKPWVLHPIVYRNKTTGISTFNMAISTSSGFNPESQDTTYGYGPYFSFWNTIPKNRYTPLLSSEYYVTRILKVQKDEETDNLFAYFIAAPTRNVSRRNFYKIKIKYPPEETAPMESVICLTCPEGKSEGGLEMSEMNPQCLWADVEMSHLGDYYLLNCKGPDVPWTVIVHTQTNRVFLNLERNEDIRAWEALIKKPRIHEFEIKLEDGFIGRARIYFPPVWHPDIKECPRQYKLLLHVDGTPEGQLVTAKYKISWLWYLILKKNFAVLEADVRGSGYQSIDMANSIWGNIGTLEIMDQIIVMEYVLKTINCIDKNNIAVYGEAYGGYTALNVMAMDHKKIFKCCAAVSPITTWQHYSYVFGVKIFGGEYDNLHRTSYEKANLASRVFGLKDKDFIIYSGTMDQEVLRYHVHNLLIALADNGIFFKHQQYIDQGHDISDYRIHLYEHIYQYFDDCFAKSNS